MVIVMVVLKYFDQVKNDFFFFFLIYTGVTVACHNERSLLCIVCVNISTLMMTVVVVIHFPVRK